jgi:hypothetical protein
LPTAAKNKLKQKEDTILHIVLTEWGWSYQEFLETPIPVFFRVWKKDQDLKKEQSKKSK